MPKCPQIHTAKNGRKYVLTPSGRPRFISKAEEHAITRGDVIDVPSKAPRRATPRRKAAPSPNLKMQTRYELDFNERQLGWILRGFIETARGRTDDLNRLFGPDDDAAQERTAHQLLLELGEELFGHLAPALRFFNVTQAEWNGWFSGEQSAPQPLPYAPPAQPPRAASHNAWLPPVTGRITSRFGVQRPSGRHAGIDIAVPTGTPIVAPQDIKIRKVSFGERPGRFVTADVVRDDGTYDGDGYKLTFAHLSQAQAQEGQVLQKGRVIGLSGATGNATGPHLHFKVQWVDDGFFSDDVIAIDPLALIPEDVFKGQAPARPPSGGAVGALKSGQPINVIVAPEAGRVSIGHGIIQPDTDVRVGSPDVNASYTAEVPAEPFTEPFEVSDVLDPLAGIVTSVADTARMVVTPETIQAAAGLVSAGSGIVTALYPKAAVATVPIGAAAGVVGAAAQPIAGVANVGLNVASGEDPFEGILT